MGSKYHCGIDVGIKGGIVVLKNGKIFFKCPMPLIGENTINIFKLCSILAKFRKVNCHVIFEAITPLHIAGKKQNWSLARQLGMIETLVAVLKLPHTGVNPKVWTKEMWAGTKVQNKKVKGKLVKDTKMTSRLAAKKIFPKENFLASKRCSVPHDGMVDAALLAEYGKRKGY